MYKIIAVWQETCLFWPTLYRLVYWYTDVHSSSYWCSLLVLCCHYYIVNLPVTPSPQGSVYRLVVMRQASKLIEFDTILEGQRLCIGKQSYGASPAICDRIALPATRHGTRPALTQSR